MTELEETTKVQIVLTWHPDSVSLFLGSLEGKRKLLQSESGKESPVRLLAGEKEEIFEVGDAGIDVAGFRAYEGDQLAVEPTAIETWRNTLDAIEVLQEGRVEEDARFEIAQANAVVTMLVTGLEAYGQKRFRELVGEGVSPDLAALAEAFPRVQEGNDEPVPLPPGDESGVLPYVERTGINFQNYEAFKKAYRAGYGLRITADAGVSSEDVRRLKAAISWRHRVIHVSPLEVIRSKPGQHPPEFVNREYAEEATELFARFINALHTSTLTLRPTDPDAQEHQPA